RVEAHEEKRRDEAKVVHPMSEPPEPGLDGGPHAPIEPDRRENQNDEQHANDPASASAGWIAGVGIGLIRGGRAALARIVDLVHRVILVSRRRRAGSRASS